MYLLDTNVVSELRKAKSSNINKKADENVVAWSGSVTATSLYISVITILELETGTFLVERRDPLQGAILRFWLNVHVLPAFSGRIHAVDTAVAQCCAKPHVPDPRADRDDILATVLLYGMTMVTRNVKDFEPTEIEILNPWRYMITGSPSDKQ